MLHPNGPDMTQAMSLYLEAVGLTWLEVDEWWRTHRMHEDAIVHRARGTADAADRPSLMDSLKCASSLPRGCLALPVCMCEDFY